MEVYIGLPRFMEPMWCSKSNSVISRAVQGIVPRVIPRPIYPNSFPSSAFYGLCTSLYQRLGLSYHNGRIKRKKTQKPKRTLGLGRNPWGFGPGQHEGHVLSPTPAIRTLQEFQVIVIGSFNSGLPDPLVVPGS